uniref:Uncharacterized protein n=1 Tax=Arundo donax TaxID=35708 RepID=A0A0A9BEU6_ARUDO
MRFSNGILSVCLRFHS